MKANAISQSEFQTPTNFDCVCVCNFNHSTNNS